VQNWMRIVREVITPGSPELRGHLTRLTEEERRLVLCLDLLNDTTLRDVRESTDQAAEF